MPPAKPADLGRLFRGSDTGRRVVVEGVVQQARSDDVYGSWITLDTAGGMLPLRIAAASIEPPPSHLVDAGIRAAVLVGAILKSRGFAAGNSPGRFRATSASRACATGCRRSAANSATALTQPLTLSQATLSGTGQLNTLVAVGGNAVISPVNSPGIQTYGTTAWNPGGTHLLELNALTGSSGTNWDQVAVTGGLDLSGLAATGTATRFNLNLFALTGSNTTGPLSSSYVEGPTYEFLIASSGSLTLPNGFSTAANTNLTSLFNISLTGWSSPAPLQSDISVRVNSTGTGLNLVIVPEPAAIALAGIGIAAATWTLRRRRRRA